MSGSRDDAGARDDRTHWEQRYAGHGDAADRPPSAWVVERCLALPPASMAVDIAAGNGRHAGALARAGRAAVAVDFIESAVAAAVARHPLVSGIVADARELPFRADSLDAIVCVSFLDRTLFPAFCALLRPGGTLVYETFTVDHLALVARGRAHGPRNPAYLLARDELSGLVAPLVVVESREGLVVDAAGERHVARVVAVKRRG